ncbi:MAG: cation:proton antiporter [Dehalococcoidia bacterium]
MFGEQDIILQLIIIIAAATCGGVVASLLRLPVILGYLVAGLIVGNYIPALNIDVAEVRDIAELGVALLLFALGVQFSAAKLANVRRVALVGGVAQIALTIALGLGVCTAIGLDVDGALLLGAAMALSSTMVALKLLDARGELDTVPGRIAVGILLVQDLAVGPLIILIPAVTGDRGATLAGEFALAAGKALLLLGVAYVLATRVVPWLLFHVASAGLRELFLLTVLSLALGMAAFSYSLGLGIAFGAFLAGLVVSESEYSYQTLAEVLPLRDVFATIFFVSMGLLIDPAVLVDDPGRVFAIASALVVGKLVLTASAAVPAGASPRTAALVGLTLAQGGEFSFVIAELGVDEGIISRDIYSSILMAVLLSIVVSPLLVAVGPRLLSWAAARPLVGPIFAESVVVEIGSDPSAFNRHVVVCGYGRVGSELVREIVRRQFRCIVIELNPYRIDRLREQGIPYIYGDAANPTVLNACALERARLLAVTVPDPASAHLILQHAKQLHPQLDVIVRGRGQDDHDALIEAGASEVVHAEFEAGLEFVRHSLHRFGVDSLQIQALLVRRRRDFHSRD